MWRATIPLVIMKYMMSGIILHNTSEVGIFVDLSSEMI